MSTPFKVGDIVRRDPKVWKRDTARFRIVGISTGTYMCQRIDASGKPVREQDVWNPGKTITSSPLPYLAHELRRV